ncbi:YodC family protein [Maribacter stanieri]|uniref:YodC family protein n=1 Tax=Maribacter stanieri TaxID=440514 RepID=UPI00249415A1|nr:DUF2158 domain-containing protein [Maribacter stanieri]
MDELKIGDVVMLKSGGPSMTIYKVVRNHISCKWFAEKELSYADFEKDELEKVV